MVDNLAEFDPFHIRKKDVHTYKLEAVFAELLCQQQGAEDCKPPTPAEHLLHLLYVHHPKDKDEFVEHKVPELVTHVLGKKGGRKGGMRRKRRGGRRGRRRGRRGGKRRGRREREEGRGRGKEKERRMKEKKEGKEEGREREKREREKRGGRKEMRGEKRGREKVR